MRIYGGKTNCLKRLWIKINITALCPCNFTFYGYVTPTEFFCGCFIFLQTFHSDGVNKKSSKDDMFTEHEISNITQHRRKGIF